MDKGGRSTVSSFQRVKEFLTQHPLSDAPATLGPQALELNDVIDRLSTDSVDQEAGTRYVRAHVESQRKLRRTLYTEHMHPISRVAREVFGATGMDKAFRMPKSAKVTHAKVTFDLKMTEGGIRRVVIRYVARRYRCLSCGSGFLIAPSASSRRSPPSRCDVPGRSLPVPARSSAGRSRRASTPRDPQA